MQRGSSARSRTGQRAAAGKSDANTIQTSLMDTFIHLRSDKFNIHPGEDEEAGPTS